MIGTGIRESEAALRGEASARAAPVVKPADSLDLESRARLGMNRSSSLAYALATDLFIGIGGLGMRHFAGFLRNPRGRH
jgi:hypothetical protein